MCFSGFLDSDFTLSNSLTFLADKITLAPKDANLLVIASPKPLEAPVIQTNFPSKLGLVNFLLNGEITN